MDNTQSSPMTVAKRLWFQSIIDRLFMNGQSKAQIAQKLNIHPQRLTNILNGSENVSDKIVDSFVLAFDLGTISLSTQHDLSILGDQIVEEKEERAIDRLEYYLILCGFSEEQAIVNARLDADTFKRIHEEDRELTDKEITAFVKAFPDLNEGWLRTGNGEMRNGYALPISNRKQPMARILELLNEEGISLEEFAKVANSKAVTFNNAIKWPFDSRSLILGNDKAIRGWVDTFCNLFPKYSKFWILSGKTSKYTYPTIEENNELVDLDKK